MNHDAMPRTIPTLALTIALALALAGCKAQPVSPQQSDENASDSGSADLRGSSIGGPFTLVDKHGKTVRWSDFAGHYRVVYFGYTYCPDVCPTDMQRTVQGEKLFAKGHPNWRKNLRTIFISVDPERDTPEVVGEFAAAFSPDVIGLTGSQEQVKAAAGCLQGLFQQGRGTARRRLPGQSFEHHLSVRQAGRAACHLTNRQGAAGGGGGACEMGAVRPR